MAERSVEIGDIMAKKDKEPFSLRKEAYLHRKNLRLQRVGLETAPK